MSWKIKINNSVDLDNKIYPSGYYETFLLDHIHGITEVFNGLNSEVIQTTKNGIKYIDRITSFKEYRIQFFVDVQRSEFFTELKLHDFLEITKYNGVVITAEEWECLTPEILVGQPNFRKITIVYRIGFVTKTNNSTNFKWVGASTNTAPTAGTVAVSGNFVSEGNIDGTYKYNDDDGDLEGTSLFRWQIADTSLGANKYQLTDTTQSITLPASVNRKYVRFGVKAIAVTGNMDSIYEYSSWYYIGSGGV